jgi:O-antigen ligase
MQVAQGPTSPLRFYQFTNPTEAVGFFANRNHFAALVYALVLLVSAWTVNAGAAAGAAFSRKEFDTASTIAAVACFTLLVVLLAAEAMARSRAGIVLTMVALLGAFSLGVADRRPGIAETATRRLLFGAIALALVLTVQFALYRILERFDVDPLQEGRLTFVANTIQAARAYMPVGSGIGSFVPVYHLFEQSQDVMANIYITRAHNDVVESWLESGVFGVALMVWFLIWFVRRSLEIWRGGVPLQADAIDWSLARSATIIVALLAAHSFLDYPLRTSAMMAVAAFACALMIEPPVSALQRRSARKSVREPTKKMLKVSPAPVLATPSAAMTPKPLTALPPSAPKERWGTDMEWPDEWAASQDRDPPKAPGGPGKPR